MNLTAWSQIRFISFVMILHDKSIRECCVPVRILPICIRIVRIMEQLPPFPVAAGSVLLWVWDVGSAVFAGICRMGVGPCSWSAPKECRL
jgi:hypothetical protein